MTTAKLTHQVAPILVTIVFAVTFGRSLANEEHPRKIDSKGLLFIRQLEGFNPDIVEDPYTGKRVIGYGHNCNTAPKKCTNLRKPITAHMANIILRSDLAEFERCVSKYTENQEITDDQFAALVSLVFSSGRGCRSIVNSRLIKSVNSGDFKEAAKYFEKLAATEMALQKRRKAELEMFCSSQDNNFVC